MDLGQSQTRTPITLESLAASSAACDVFTSKQLLRSAVLRAKLLRCSMRGMNATQAAKIVGCSVATACAIYRESSFRRQTMGMVEGALSPGDQLYQERTKTVQERIQDATDTAFDLLMEVLADPTEDKRLRVKVAEGLLDRNPDTAKQSQSTTTEIHRFSVEELALAARAADELDRHSILPIRRSEEEQSA